MLLYAGIAYEYVALVKPLWARQEKTQRPIMSLIAKLSQMQILCSSRVRFETHSERNLRAILHHG